jgi:hypothetical protein
VVDIIFLISTLIYGRNIGHFGQAHGTPFASAPLNTIYQYGGTNTLTKQLIQEQFIPNDLIEKDQYTQAIIDQLSDSNLPINQHNMTFEEFKWAFIKWSEKTNHLSKWAPSRPL